MREIVAGAFYWVRDKDGEWNVALSDEAAGVPLFFPFQTPEEAEDVDAFAEIGPLIGTEPPP